MDPIANMFSQIKNAQNAHFESVTIPCSKIKVAILDILKQQKHIIDYKILDYNKGSKLGSRIEIKLPEDGCADIQRISKPSRRVYSSSINIPYRRRVGGLVIISTSEGVLEGEAARKKGLGGEIIAELK